MLQMDMSLGKTGVCLTAIADMLDQFLIKGALVVAPRRVAESVWTSETEEWEQTAHLRICVLRNKNKGVLSRDLLRPYHVWVINYESLPWLYNEIVTAFLHQGRYPPFDLIVFDEVTRVKHPGGARISPWHAKTGGVCLLDYFPRRIGLTGTPAPNGYLDLFGQYLAVDGGARLGPNVTDYKRQYFLVDQERRRVWLRLGAKEQIESRIHDMTISMAADDYLTLPPYVVNDLWVELPPAARKQYDQLEAEMFAELEETRLEVFNAASLTAKCRQMANGAVRHQDDRDKVSHIHEAKLEALDEVLEEAAGSGVLIATNIFVRENGAWKMVHHQAGPTAGVPDDEEGQPT